TILIGVVVVSAKLFPVITDRENQIVVARTESRGGGVEQVSIEDQLSEALASLHVRFVGQVSHGQTNSPPKGCQRRLAFPSVLVVMSEKAETQEARVLLTPGSEATFPLGALPEFGKDDSLRQIRPPVIWKLLQKVLAHLTRRFEPACPNKIDDRPLPVDDVRIPLDASCQFLQNTVLPLFLGNDDFRR